MCFMLNVFNVLNVLSVPKDALSACWYLFWYSVLKRNKKIILTQTEFTDTLEADGQTDLTHRQTKPLVQRFEEYPRRKM